MGIVDMITGQNPNQGAIDASQNAANQATQGQNALIQGALLPAYNQLLQNYQQNYMPLQGPLGNTMQGLLGGNSTAQLGQLSSLLSANPQLLQQLTGVNSLGVGQNAVDYLSNPGATLSGLGGIGGSVLAGELGPTLGGTQGIGGQVISGLMGPTSLGAVTPQAMQQFLQTSQQGLSPQTIGSALNTQESATQRQINSLRNAVGAGTPNIGGLTSDLNLQGLQGLTGTESQLAGMNQAAQRQGMMDALGAAGGLDQQTMQRLLASEQTAQGIDNQSLQRLLSAESTAGSIDQNTMNMLMNANQIAQGINQGAFGNLGQGLNFQQGLLGNIMNYTGQGLNSLLGGTSGISNIANLYGQAAGGAANNMMQLAMAGNQANSNTFSGLAGLAGSLAGAGLL